MDRIKLLFLQVFVLLLVVVPSKIYALHTNNIDYGLFFENGTNVKNIGTIDKKLLDRYKPIDFSLVEPIVSLGNSNAIYYDKEATGGKYSKGIYEIPTTYGTTYDLFYKTTYPEVIKTNESNYDVVITVNSIFDQEQGSIFISPNNFSFSLNEDFSSLNNINPRYHGLNFQVDIYRSGTTSIYNMPGVMLGILDLDGEDCQREGVKIKNFIPNKDNTFIVNDDSTIEYTDYLNNFYGTSFTDKSFTGSGSLYLKLPNFRNANFLEGTYASNLANSSLELSLLLEYFTVNYKADLDGNITDMGSEDVFNDNDKLKGVDPTIFGDYDFLYWTCNKDIEIDGEVKEAGYHLSNDDIKDFVVKDSLEFTAHYKKKVKYKIEKTAAFGGISSVDEVLPGEDVTVSYYADEGYHLESILVDGKEVDINDYPTFYTFVNVNNNHTIVVRFAPNKYEIKTSVIGGDIDSSLKVDYGADVTISYSPFDGYRLSKVIVDGVLVNYPREYDFINVKENHTIEVIYEKIPVVEAIKTSDKKDYKEGEEVSFTVTLSQKIDGAVARDVIITDTLPDELVLDESSFILGDDVEILEMSNTYYKLKIDEISEEKSITYKAIVKENITNDELISNIVVEVSGSDDVILENNKIYIPRGKITNSLKNDNLYYDDIAEYTIKVSQITSGASLHGVKIQEILPPELELIEASSDDASVIASDNMIYADVKELSEDLTINVKAKIKVKDGKVTTVSILKADELVYPLEASSSLNILPAKFSIKSNVPKKASYKDLVECIYSIKGEGVRNGRLEIDIPRGLNFIKNSINLSGNFELNDNKLIVNYKKLDDLSKISFRLKVTNYGSFKIKGVFNGENISDNINFYNILKVKKVKNEKKKSFGKELLTTKIPITGLNDNMLDIIMVSSFMIFVIGFLIIFRKRL